MISAGVTEDQYYSALSISPDSDFDLHLKRPVDSCFINNYFVAGIKGFGVNVDYNQFLIIINVSHMFVPTSLRTKQSVPRQ